MSRLKEARELPAQAIAVIGMAGRFPGAKNLDALWANLVAGKDTITRFEDALKVSADYVSARGVLDGVEFFDAEYFNIPPREAERIDPQHRVFLEVCASALEDAGYASENTTEEIGLFAGCSLNTYLLANLCADRGFIDELTSNYQVGEFASALGNDKDFLTTRVAYKLNLRGPCMTVQGACATSLVAVAQACQSLLTYQCGMALAGGVSITFPQKRGHMYQEGAISSRDGYCKPFDADASGTVFGHGAGVVVLKRLEDAVRDGDHIEAVIRGFAVNNDGGEKAGYMAPGVNGQVRVIAMAQAMADVTPESVSYVEAHGTGTPIGDPIEIAALTEAFRQGTDRTGFCTVGSIKGNLGHLDSAAGAAGLIKTVLSLKHRTLPGLLHFTKPNPQLALEDSPFIFTAETKPWTAAGPLRAGVSAFGVGGVNSHLVLEEAPVLVSEKAVRAVYPVCLSARSADTLTAMREELAAYLEAHPDISLADISYTLAVGRKTQSQRFAAVVADSAGAVAALRGGDVGTALDAETKKIVEAWARGESVNWAKFFEGDERLRISLPTTIFKKTVHWIEPPAATKSLLEVPSTGEVTMPTTSNELVDRLPRLVKRVAEVLFDLSGIAIPEADSEVPFFELGFDSLFLTQASSSLEKAFGVKISFRQLMENLDSVKALAEYVDELLPPETAAPSVTAAPVAKAASGSVEALLAAQMEQLNAMFKSQVEALRVAAGGTAAPTAAQAVVAPPVIKPSEVSTPASLRHGSFRPLQTRNNEPITPKQSAYIAELIRTYVAKTPTSKMRTQEARAHLADPRAVAGFRPQWKEMVYPLVTDRAKGSRIWDVDGNEYIDMVNGYGCIMFGHSPEFVVEAVRKQIDSGVAIGPQSHLAGEVAKMIADLTGNDRVTFCNTGSEAVMAAMRIARMVTGRDRIVYFAGDYHGTFDEVLARMTPRGTTPVAPGIPMANLGNITVLEYGTDASLEFLRANAAEIAAVLVEPVQTRHPELQPVEFLRTVRKLTEDAGSAMIIDEVVTGFRLAPGGVQQEFGIRADLCTYGKVIGGGYPIGVLSGKSRFMDALDGGHWQFGDDSVPEAGVTFFAGTFVRHPQAMAAAKAVLKHLTQAGPALQQTLNRKTKELAGKIGAMFQERGVPCQVHSFASWFYFVFPGEAKLASLFYYSMRAKGIHIQESYPCFLTTAHTDADLARVEECFRLTIEEMQASEAMPGLVAPVEELAVEDVLAEAPLTEAQSEIFLAAALNDEASCAFNESLRLDLRGEIRKGALQLALDTALSRHDALRAVISEDGEKMIVNPAFPGEVEWIDLSAKAADQQRHAISSRVTLENRTAFDLHAGPLVRVVAFVLGASEVTLLITAHHIVLDGWSSNQLLEDIGALYSRGDGSQTGLARPASFARYAVRERERRQAGEFTANESYWVKQFEGKSPKLNLPTDFARPEIKSYAGATLEGTLDGHVLEAARVMARKSGCSLFVALLSAFQMLLHRLTQQEEVVVGISTAGQALLDGQALVGHCVNFLPMLSELKPAETVKEHLKATRAALLDAQEHQEFTFGSLLKKLSLDREAGRLPLIEVQFNLEKSADANQFSGLAARVRTNPKQFVNTDLFLNVMETASGFLYTLDYNTELFEHATMQRWMAMWSTLLACATETVEKPVAALALMSESERDDVLKRWNKTAVDYGPFQSAQEMVLGWAARDGQRTAVECNGRSWTYSELEEYASLLARRMVHEGVRPGMLVGICMERSLEMVGGLLAVMMAGAAFVPLDPRHPRERLASVLADANITYLLTSRDPRVAASRTINITGPQPAFEEALPQVCTIETLAYVIYTSGSTGAPKGVMIQHGALTNLLKSMQQKPGFAAQDGLLAVTTLAFDIATLELLLPLISGGRLVIATDEECTDGVRLLEMMTEKQITVVQATPGLWRILLDAGLAKKPSLKILCGGEALPRDLADQLLDVTADVWNVYGPTETTIWSSAGRVVRSEKTPSIGPPIANTQMYVLCEGDQPAPLGVTGELVIGGAGLAQGYWHREELTAERFAKIPFASGRMYRTGDLAKRNKDGSLEILGRSDFQVKVRGYRIELGDIEAALRKHEEVREAVVIAVKPTGAAASRLVGFVELSVATVNEEALRKDLQLMLRGALPEYMVPDAIEVLGALPRTANGKIDRKSLRPGLQSERHKSIVTLPTSSQEIKLVAIWSEILGVSEISTTDSIFELGADSLAIFRIAARCQRELMPLKAAQIFQYRTIVALAKELLREPEETKLPVSGPRIQATSRDRYKLKR